MKCDICGTEFEAKKTVLFHNTWRTIAYWNGTFWSITGKNELYGSSEFKSISNHRLEMPKLDLE